MKNKADEYLITTKSKEYSFSQWDGFIHSRCPRCRLGRVFSGSVYGLKIQR